MIDSSYRARSGMGRLMRGAAALGVMTTVGCAKPVPPPKKPVAVTVATAQRGSVPYVIGANGQVEPINSVAIQAQAGGVITDVLFKEGADVVLGQPLIKIDPRPSEAALRQAEAVLARDQVSAASAGRDAERYAALVLKDYVTKSQADQAIAAAAAQTAVVDADKAAVENARLNLEYTTIRAPISGRTGSLLVHAGNVVRPGGGEPLITINQIHPIRIRFSVPERYLAEVQRYAKLGAVRVTANPATGGEPETGVLTFVENAVDTITGTVTLKGEFPNPSGRLWPGQFLPVQVELYVEPNVVTVPTAAVVVGQNGAYVFVVEAGNTVKVQPVETARAFQDKTIISKGLDAGIQVVTDGQSRLEAGAKVEVKPGVQ